MARTAKNESSRWTQLGNAGATAVLVLTLALTVALLGSLTMRFARTEEAGSVIPPVTAQRIRVQVQNGCGVSGAARSVASLIQGKAGIDVVDVGNARTDGLHRSVVIDRGGYAAEAARVAGVLGVDAILLQRRPHQNGVDVTVVVGYDRGRWEAGQRLRGGQSAVTAAPEG